MITLGLTGSIGMGKSTAAQMLQRMGVPVWDADEAVHRLYRVGGEGAEALAAIAPQAVGPAGVDRPILASMVGADPALLGLIERAIHPLVWRDEQRFRRWCQLAGRSVIALDVPMLLESPRRDRCDTVIVVWAPAFLQRQRVLSRPGMTPARLETLLSRQMPSLEKMRRADYVVPTGLGKATTWRALAAILRKVRSRAV
jgi:dephospho-CoA kinase